MHCLSFIFILYFDQGLEDFIIEQPIVNNFVWNKNILKDIGFNEQHYVFVLYVIQIQISINRMTLIKLVIVTCCMHMEFFNLIIIQYI